MPCLDGIFSIVTAALRAERDLQTPQDIMRTLGEKHTWAIHGPRYMRVKLR